MSGDKLFVGRVRELEQLENLYSRQNSQTCAVYGRRRVGKTTMIQEFCKNKKSLFLTTIGSTKDTILRNMSVSFSGFFDENIIVETIDSFMVLLRRAQTENEGLIIVIDEFPFLVESFPEITSFLQIFIDHDMKSHKSMLILCGSSMGAMKNLLNDGDGPLYMRFPIQMRLSPLSYIESRFFHPNYSEEDKIKAYAICGGVPLYHSLLGNTPIESAIENHFLRNTGSLNTEAENVLSLELKPWETYSKLLQTMGNGPVEMKEITKNSGLSRVTCISLLENLMLLGVVIREAPYGKERDMTYHISDGLLSFYYSVMIQNGSILAMNLPNPYESLRRHIDTFYGRRFEEVCKQYIVDTRTCMWIGKWWGTKPVMKNGFIQKDSEGKVLFEESDVDIVAKNLTKHAEYLILCECKFTNKEMRLSDLEKLTERGDYLVNGKNKRYVLFSKSGFDSDLEEYVEYSSTEYDDESVELVNLQRITDWAEKKV